MIAFDLQMQLEELGHDVIAIARDFAAARAAVDRQVPDLAFMDLRLAGGDSGEDVARWLRDDHGVGCIFMSANLDRDTRERLGQFEPLAFIGKPAFPHMIADALSGIGTDPGNGASV